MHINFYLFSDNGGDEEERRRAHIRGAQGYAERRGTGKDSYFRRSTSRHHRHPSRIDVTKKEGKGKIEGIK